MEALHTQGITAIGYLQEHFKVRNETHTLSTKQYNINFSFNEQERI